LGSNVAVRIRKDLKQHGIILVEGPHHGARQWAAIGILDVDVEVPPNVHQRIASERDLTEIKRHANKRVAGLCLIPV
jgi:hypothetical protein